MNEAYRAQVRLLIDILPFVAKEEDFALKGGTAINLFVRDLPRLSVDIDLTYLRLDDRETAFGRISTALSRIKRHIEDALPGARVSLVDQGGGIEAKLQVQRARTQVKVEVNTTLRGHLWPVRKMANTAHVERLFEAFVEMPVVSHAELFGGKICAALDRQHPRDLFDVRVLLDAEGVTDDIRLGLIAALVGHNRPVSELLSGRMQNRDAAFTAEFEGMTLSPFDYAAHVVTFTELLERVREGLGENDRRFLMSFEAGEPDWDAFPQRAIQNMPGVQWKLLNIRKLKATNPAKHAAGLAALERVLSCER